MSSGKRKFLQTFDDFLDSFQNSNYGKCYFKFVNGKECQGWITEINDDTFVYLDSGPLASEEPYIFEIDEIDINTFAYWDDEVKKWTEYFVPDKFKNRTKIRT